MMRICIIIIIILIINDTIKAQNSAGETSSIDSMVITWSLGELAVENYNGIYPSLSQGIVQPFGIPFAIPSGVANRKNFEEIVNDRLDVNEPTLGLTVYPNPTNGPIHITWPESNREVEVVIYDMLGQVVYQHQLTVNNYRLELNLEYVNPGVYNILLSSGDQWIRKKIIKE